MSNNEKQTTPQTNRKEFIGKATLLNSGIQFGHQARRWNPAIKPFIHGTSKGVHIFDLNKTVSALQLVYKAIKDISEKGGKFLFVGTKPHSRKTIKENAVRSESFYIDQRWLGGLLTNWKTIQNSINKLHSLEKMEQSNFVGYKKKEALLLRREKEKLEGALGGIKFMRRLPNAIFVSSVHTDLIAVKEARKMKIPVFGIVDSNVDPFEVQFPIPGNDDTNKSVALVTTIVADAIVSARGGQTLVAYQEDEKAQVLGVEMVDERPEIKDLVNRKTRNLINRHSGEKKNTKMSGDDARKEKFNYRKRNFTKPTDSTNTTTNTNSENKVEVKHTSTKEE